MTVEIGFVARRNSRPYSHLPPEKQSPESYGLYVSRSGYVKDTMSAKMYKSEERAAYYNGDKYHDIVEIHIQIIEPAE